MCVRHCANTLTHSLTLARSPRTKPTNSNEKSGNSSGHGGDGGDGGLFCVAVAVAVADVVVVLALRDETTLDLMVCVRCQYVSCVVCLVFCALAVLCGCVTVRVGRACTPISSRETRTHRTTARQTHTHKEARTHIQTGCKQPASLACFITWEIGACSAVLGSWCIMCDVPDCVRLLATSLFKRYTVVARCDAVSGTCVCVCECCLCPSPPSSSSSSLLFRASFSI